MSDTLTDITFERAVYAHHQKYRYVAQSKNLSQSVLNEITKLNYHIYYNDRIKDEKYQPVKYRYFKITVDNKEYFVLSRLEAMKDLVTFRGMVNNAQFYIIQGDQIPVFANQLHYNAAHLLAQIKFLQLELARLPIEAVMDIPPVTLRIPSNSLEKYNDLKHRLSDREWNYLFSDTVLEKLDDDETIYIHSKKFSDSIDLFNILTRGFFTGHLDEYRKHLTFTTSEYKDQLNASYKIVFLAGIDLDVHLPEATNVISLDKEVQEPSRTTLWYLNQPEQASLRTHISQRILKRNTEVIPLFEHYPFAALGEKNHEVLNAFQKRLLGLRPMFRFLSGEAIARDIMRVVNPYLVSETPLFLKHLQSIFESLFLLVSPDYKDNPTSWAQKVYVLFIKSTIKWFEKLLTQASTFDEFAFLRGTLAHFKHADDSIQRTITQQMLKNQAGIAVYADNTKGAAQYFGPFFSCWSVYITSCEKAILNNHLFGDIWTFIIGIIENMPVISETDESLSLSLSDLLLTLCGHLETTMESDMGQDALDHLYNKKLFSTYTRFVGRYLITNKSAPSKRNDFASHLINQLDAQIPARNLDDLAHEVSELLKDEQTSNPAQKIVTALAEKSIHQRSLHAPIKRLFIFTGTHYPIAADHIHILHAVIKGVNKQENNFAPYLNFLSMQEELLFMVGLNNSERAKIRTHSPEGISNGLVMRLKLPAFENKWTELTAYDLNDFYKNLIGLKDRALEERYLAVTWSYLQIMPEFLDAERIYDLFIQYLKDLIRRKNDTLPEILSKNFQFIAKHYTPESRIKTIVNLRTSAFRSSLTQLALTTQNKKSRIEKLIGLINYEFESKTKKLWIQTLEKHYAEELPKGPAQETWKSRLSSSLPKSKK